MAEAEFVLSSNVKSNRWRALASAGAALLLAVSLGLTACGGERAPQRSNFDTVVAPERCVNAGACG